MVIRSTPSNDNTSSNRVYTINDIMSPSLLTPSTDNALSRRTLAQRGRRKRERDRQLREPTNCQQPAVHHDVEAVYYNPIESDDERNIDDEGNDNVNEVDEDNINANAFTSLGVHMDNRVARGRGPTSFVIHGELQHRIGAVVPNEEQ
ncbi:hypothetical protein GIB67_023153 [Kingdonia uniflora]|uniref:Uncharacterized protein n=1 Tax=Kingdonia uniflora TaxID=39325 RepID=A0A7J7M5Z8_9MAGN|nr:hypothetical protein GIB67_023153 [Kingdonia uniflora]